MKWRKGDAYYIQTDTHTVCKIVIGPETFYEAWRKGTPAVCLGCRLSTSNEARELCERDADE